MGFLTAVEYDDIVSVLSLREERTRTIIRRTLSVGGTIMNQRQLSSRATSLSISVASCSDRGRVRKHNEDAIALCDPPDQLQAEQLGKLYLLADGAGGHAAGEVASHLAVETIAAVYYRSVADGTRSQGFLSHPHALHAATESPFVCIQMAF